MSNEPKKQTTYVRLTADQHERVHAIADAEGLAMSDVIRRAITAYLSTRRGSVAPPAVKLSPADEAALHVGRLIARQDAETKRLLGALVTAVLQCKEGRLAPDIPDWSALGSAKTVGTKDKREGVGSADLART